MLDTGVAPTAAQLRSMTVLLEPTELPTNSPVAGRVDANGEFRSAATEPGWYRLAALGGAGLVAAHAMLNGVDALDVPFELKTEDVNGVVLTLTAGVGQVAGTVKAQGTSLASTDVLMIPADTRAWIEAGMTTRHAQRVTPSQSGAYSVTGLLPGEYIIAAVDESTGPDLNDPRYVEALARAGTRVTIAAGDRKSMDLQTVTVPQ
jgi:hypothetical protein